MDLWVPLETTYDRKTHTVSAVAPHFSLYRTMVVDPESDLWSAETTGPQALVKRVLQQAAAFGSALYQAVTGHQQTIDCSSASPAWTVTSPRTQVHGCVTVAQDGTPTLHLASGLFYPLLVSDPVELHPEQTDPEDVAAGVVRYLDNHAGLLSIEPLGAADADLPAVAASADVGVRLNLTPDALAMAVNAIFLGLSVVPGEGKFLKLVESNPKVWETIPVMAGGELDFKTVEHSLGTIAEYKKVPVKQKPAIVEAAEITLDAAGRRGRPVLQRAPHRTGRRPLHCVLRRHAESAEHPDRAAGTRRDVRLVSRLHHVRRLLAALPGRRCPGRPTA